MKHFEIRPTLRLITGLVIWVLILLVEPHPVYSFEPDLKDKRLHEMRAARRQGMRAANIAGQKSAAAAPFGLLVIPVDFQDARLGADWRAESLAPRLTGTEEESLHRYFAMASTGKLDLRITLAPLVNLPGQRRDYSDIDLNGFFRTRKMAGEALTAMRELGLEFRRLDMDGPDGIAGTADDDGEIDGVLILHAGIGQENDPDNGLIQPLQFFLDEPVVSDGVAGVFYAVASMHSGPGIWAHETAHLIGLEDRYDPLLANPGSEVEARGGLGRFSLMAAGAWGTGHGYGAALPDAYSASLLGWYRVRDFPGTAALADTLIPAVDGGEVVRIWSAGRVEPEFFLLECRDNQSAHPFDAALPADQMVIYHIDESLPEGRWLEDSPGNWHLRARLVEADDDDRLAKGLDDGRDEDLFPGPLGVTAFGSFTTPASDGYQGPSGVSLRDIASSPGHVTFTGSNSTELEVAFQFGFTGSGPQVLDLKVQPLGPQPDGLQATISIAGNPSWGNFEGGQVQVDLALSPTADGLWIPSSPIVWLPDRALPAGARTEFLFRFDGPAFDSGSLRRTWHWTDNAESLDFQAHWPGEWVIDHPGGNSETTWHRWAESPWVNGDGSPVLACTGAAYPTSADWPDVVYGNRAHTTLTSGPLGPGITGIRIVHALEVEILTGTTAMDGAVVAWVGPDGAVVPAVPVDGWTGTIANRAVNPLHGRQALVQANIELAEGIPLWRTDVFSIPESGPGPWKLQLEFASNTLFRQRGWFVGRIEPLFQALPSSAFPVSWQAGVHWSWPWDNAQPRRFVVEARDPQDSGWTTLADELFSPQGTDGGYFLPSSRILPNLPGPARERHRLRVRGADDFGGLQTRLLVVYADGGDGQKIFLGSPWPNPSTDKIRIMLDIPLSGNGQLSILDLRGRRLVDRSFPPGSHLFVWDGRDGRGRRAASGTYFIRLEGSGPVTTRKVVLLR